MECGGRNTSVALRRHAEQAAGELEVYEALCVRGGGVLVFGDGDEEGFERGEVFVGVVAEEEKDVVGCVGRGCAALRGCLAAAPT